MGYHIQYGETIEKVILETPSVKKSSKLKLVIILLCVSVLCFAVHQKKDIVTRYILPGDAEVTAAALDALVENLKEGDGFGDAVTAFCREIIDHADVS